MIYVRTPATTANMGPGFDCIGMAFQLHNELWAEETDGGLVIENKRADMRVPSDERNMIYASIRRFFQETGKPYPFAGLRLIQNDDIPKTRGLGSSAACIVSGLAAANALSGMGLPKEELAEMAAMIEGHPDNAVPAALGGLVVAATTEGAQLEYIRLDASVMEADGLRFGVVVPDFPLSTSAARKILPDEYTRADTVFNTSRAALMVAAVCTRAYDKLFTAMDDRLHQPYRRAQIPGMAEIFTAAREAGAKGVFLSGAGPAIVAVYDANEVRSGLMRCLRTLKEKWILLELPPDMDGVQVTAMK